MFLLAVCLLPLLSFAETRDPSSSNDDNPYNARFDRIRIHFDEADALRQTVLIAEAYRLREYVDRADDVRIWLESIVATDSLNPLVRDEAAMRLASVQASEGDLIAAERSLVGLGFVRNWSVLGPLPRDSRVAVLTTGYWSGDVFPDGRGGTRTWRPISALGTHPELKLSDFFPLSDSSIAYLTTSIFSDADRDVALRFSSEVPLCLFVNGSQVFSRTNPASFAFDQTSIGINLRSGWNSLVVKVELGGGGPARFAARVTALDGGGLPLRSWATRDAEVVDSKTQPSERPYDLVDMARIAWEANPRSADRLAILGTIEREHARAADLEHLEAAARIEPTGDRWLDLARSCRDASCRFTAFSSALRADSASVEARIGLADYYFSRNQLDVARDFLREALAICPRHYLVRDRLAELYLAAGLTAIAKRESSTAIRDFPGPLWLARSVGTRFADLGVVEQALPLLKRSLLYHIDTAGEYQVLERIYRRRHDAIGLGELLRHRIAKDPNDAAAIADLSQLQLGSGDSRGAKLSIQQALEISPDSDYLREKAGEILSRAGEDRAAEQQFAHALQLNPRREDLRRRLRLASNGDSNDDALAYLENPAELVAQANCPWIQAGTNVAGISDVRIERVYDNGLSAVRSQQIFCMASEQGARDFATRVIQYSPASQDLAIHHARVHKADGRLLDASEAGETSVADTSISMYYDVRSRTLRFPDLQKGDVVELDYTISPTLASNPYGDYFAALVPFRSLMPESLQKYVLIAPSKRRLSIVEHGIRPASREHRGDDQIYRWEERNLAALPNEPRGPALTESAPYIHVSTFGSWDDLGRWYAELITPQFQMDNTLREVAARITTGKQTEVEKINAIHQFVLRNTHYVALEFGVYSYKPYAVTQVYARRFGDCKDKASLMVALLRESGIDADIALVRTRRLGDIEEKAVSIALFNHAIVYIPKWDLWLDGTAEYAGSRELPLDDQGAMALVVGSDGSGRLRRIPVTRPEDNFSHRVVRARVESNGNIEFTGTSYTRGEDVPGLRRDYEIAERQRDLFRNSLALVFPTVRLDDVRIEGANDLERDINVEFRGALDTFSGRRSLTLNTSWMPRSYVQTLAQLESRKQDLVLSAPWITEEELRFQLPAGTNVDSVPSDKSFDTPFGSARIRYQRHGREVSVNTSVQFRKTRITPAEYGAFREFCRDVEGAFRAEVKVTLPAS